MDYEGTAVQLQQTASNKIRLTEALERLVQLYEAMDKKDDAAKWRKELDATKAAQKRGGQEAMRATSHFEKAIFAFERPKRRNVRSAEARSEFEKNGGSV
jgi:hypothetical protein